MRVLFAEIIALPVDDQIMGDIPHDELRHEVACFRFVCLAASVVIDEAVRSRICRGGSAVEGDAAAENLQTAIRLNGGLAADSEGCRPAVAFNGQSGIAFRGDACAGLRRDGVGSAYADQRVDLLGCSDTGWIGNSDRPAVIILQVQQEQRRVVAIQSRIGFPAFSAHWVCTDLVGFIADGKCVDAGLRAVLLPLRVEPDELVMRLRNVLAVGVGLASAVGLCVPAQELLPAFAPAPVFICSIRIDRLQHDPAVIERLAVGTEDQAGLRDGIYGVVRGRARQRGHFLPGEQLRDPVADLIFPAERRVMILRDIVWLEHGRCPFSAAVDHGNVSVVSEISVEDRRDLIIAFIPDGGQDCIARLQVGVDQERRIRLPIVALIICHVFFALREGVRQIKLAVFLAGQGHIVCRAVPVRAAVALDGDGARLGCADEPDPAIAVVFGFVGRQIAVHALGVHCRVAVPAGERDLIAVETNPAVRDGNGGIAADGER